MSEYLFLPRGNEPHDGFWAFFTLKRLNDFFLAQGFVYAPHRGDEIMEVVTRGLQQLASLRQETIVHQYTPMNDGAEALILRVGGYVARVLEGGGEIYERTYYPGADDNDS